MQRYVDLRDAGFDPFQRTRRARLIDPYLEKVEELVEDSHGKIRADVVHERLRAMGFGGNQRTTRRAVAAIRVAYRAGRRRSYRPWPPMFDREHLNEPHGRVQSCLHGGTA